jgi:hypothetical protein
LNTRDQEEIRQRLDEIGSRLRKFLQMIAMATRAAIETNAATEKLSDEIEPLALSREINLATASRSDLEALRRDLKTADDNATTFMPRYIAVFKAERDKVENYALAPHIGKNIVSGLLDGVDRRHAKTTDLTSRMLLARVEFYRAYEKYVAVGAITARRMAAARHRQIILFLTRLDRRQKSRIRDCDDRRAATSGRR